MPHRSVRFVLTFLALLAALAATASPSSASSPVVVLVPADHAGPVDTGITLAAGQQATITADGSAYCDAETNLPCYGGPEGAGGTCSDYGLEGCVAPTLPGWSLVGRLDGRPWQLIGAGPTTVTGPGHLVLQYNDADISWNGGEFTAIIDVSDIGDAKITSITGTPTSVAPRSAAIPYSALSKTQPLGDDTAASLANAPLRSSPLRSSPLRSSPLRSSPLRSSPLRSSALGSLTLAQLPLRSSSWDQLLAGTSLDLPPASLTLDQVLSLSPLPAGLNALTLADLDLAKSPLRSSSLGLLLLAGTTLANLPQPDGTTWCQLLSLQDNCALDQKTLADVEQQGNLWRVDLGGLVLNGPGTDVSGSILAGIALADLDLAGTPLAGRTDLGAYATVGQLVRALPLPGLTKLTLGDLLPGLVAPQQLPLQLAPLRSILDAAPRSTSGLLKYRIALDVRCGATSLNLSATLPPTARFVPGSGAVTAGATTTSLATAAGPNAQTLDFDLLPAYGRACPPATARDTMIVTFDVEPPAHLGTPLLTVVARADGVAFGAQGAGARVEDLDDPGDTPASAATLGTGTLRTGYLADGNDADAYVIDAPPVGSTVTLVLSHLPADYDLSVTGPPVGIPSAPLRSSPLRSSPLRSSPLRSSTIGEDGNLPTGSATPSALQDLPLRSSELANTPLRSSSINRGLNTESTSFTVAPDDAGKRFTVHVTGYDGAHSDDPYVLRAEVSTPKAAPQCRAARTLPSAAKGAFPSLPLAASTKTIFLINQQRLAQLYPSADITALRTKLNALAARPEVAGAVIPVESDPANPTSSAYAAWDANPCSVTAANGVAAAIRAVVGNVTQNLDGLKNIVVIGGDAVIPQVRVPDLVGTANEREEADAAVFGGRDSAASRSLRDGFLLTDDAYGDFDPEASLGGAFFVPDVALGRLVEKPADIVAQLDQYTAAGGRLATGTTHVSGYDFLTDGAQEILAQLSKLPETQTTSQINETWTAADATTALNRPVPGITSVNAHYDHYRALPASAFNGLVPDLLKAKDISPAAGSLLFTAGCHAGLALEDVDQPNATTAEADRLQDWAQQVTSRAVFIANTTYGYGDTETVAYTERLLGLLADGIASRQVTSGQALMIAKQRYAAEQATPGVYDQKSSMGLTYYGLPFFTVGASGGEGPAVLPSSPPAGTQVRSSNFTVDANLVRHDLNDGNYRAWWSVGNEPPQATHGKPLQPRTTLDVTATDGLPVHGAVVEDLVSDYAYGVRGVYSQPTIDLEANEPRVPESEHDGTLFPSWILRTTRGATTGGLRDQLVVVPGQYKEAWSLQTLYPHISGSVLRSDSTDYEPPVITSTDALTSFPPAGGDGTATFTVKTSATDAVRALVLFRNDSFSGNWTKVELTKVPGTTDTWTGTAPLQSYQQDLSYSVQVVDNAGNVGVSTNKGTEYPSVPADRERQPEFSVSPAPAASGYAGGPVKVTLDPGTRQGVTFQVSVDGAAPVPYTTPITVSGDGLHTLRFTGSDGTEGGTLVKIDAAGPAVTGTSTPAASPEGFLAGPVTIIWACTDGVSGVSTCPAPTTLQTEGTGITATSPAATDRADNSRTGSVGPLSIDMNAPTGAVTPGTTGASALGTTTSAAATPVTVNGSAADTLAGVRSVKITYTSTTAPTTSSSVDATVTCAAADRRSCTWSSPAPTTAGTWNVSALVTDRAGRTATVGGAAPITTTVPTTTPPPTSCKPTISISWEWKSVDITVTVLGKKIVIKQLLLVQVTITLPCCTPASTSAKDKAACAIKLAVPRKAALKEARAKARVKAKALLKAQGVRPKAPDRPNTKRILPR